VFLSRPADAFDLLRGEGVGITDADLNRIPIGLAALSGLDSDADGLPDALEDALGTDPRLADSDGDGFADPTEIVGGYDARGTGRRPIDADFAARQRGRIFLQVEGHGEAWWINPDDRRRYFLGRPADAFALMRSFGLGITTKNLSAIPTGSVAASGQASAAPVLAAAVPSAAAQTGDSGQPAVSASGTCADGDAQCLIKKIRAGQADDVRVNFPDNVFAVRKFGPFDSRWAYHELEYLRIGSGDYLTGSQACLFDDRNAMANALADNEATGLRPNSYPFATCCVFNPNPATGLIRSVFCDADFPDGTYPLVDTAKL
jgi:hypothetical protein